MLRQIQKLTALQLCNLFGINEVRYTKDKKKKQNFILLSFVWFLLIGMLVFYVALLSIGLCTLGMSDIIPIYLYMITSLIILFFSFFKAGNIIFQMKNFDMLVSLPISQTTIVTSRFFSMYATNLLLSVLVMVPGTIVYGINEQPGLSFYIIIMLGTLILPLLPMTLSTAVGALITGIGSRMKHKNLAVAALTLIFSFAVIVASMIFGSNTEHLTPEMLQNFVNVITEQIQNIYPPAVWFGTAALNGNFLTFFMLLAVSIIIFVFMAAFVQKHFMGICHALNTTSTKNNYKMESLTTNSVLSALCKREIKRYFASSTYVSNTIMGYILMLILPIALLFTGTEQLELTIGYPGLISKALPILLGLVAGMMPITSCAISMEGKNWWLMQTLPMETKTIMDSKILTNLIIAGPFYVGTIILSFIALKPSGMSILWLILIPASYILFSSVAGLAINMKFPVMIWENEAQVVKQSASTLVTMLVDFLVGLPPVILLLAVNSISKDVIMGGTAIILLSLTAIIYRSNNKKPILQIN